MKTDTDTTAILVVLADISRLCLQLDEFAKHAPAHRLASFAMEHAMTIGANGSQVFKAGSYLVVQLTQRDEVVCLGELDSQRSVNVLNRSEHTWHW